MRVNKGKRRHRYTATFVKYDYIKSNYPEKFGAYAGIILLEDIIEDGKKKIDPLAINRTKGFDRFTFFPGDKLSFEARPSYYNGRLKLTFPSNIKKL